MLAFLVPLRGAAGAAMLCHTVDLGTASESRANEGDHGHFIDCDGHGRNSDGSDRALEESTGSEHKDGGAAHKCGMCTACGSLASIDSRIPTLFEPLEPAAAFFPELHAPLPSFHSGGQDRPPRTI